MKSAHEDKEKFIGNLLFGGVGCFLAGILFTFLAIVMQSGLLFAIGPPALLLGLVLAGAGLAIGYTHNRVQSTPSTPASESEGRITARFAINDIGEMIFDNFEYDAEEARYYIRVQFLGGKREEFECARPVFDQCGEGMRGLLTIQGGWLSRFVPLIDTDETRAAYRDW